MKTINIRIMSGHFHVSAARSRQLAAVVHELGSPQLHFEFASILFHVQEN